MSGDPSTLKETAPYFHFFVHNALLDLEAVQQLYATLHTRAKKHALTSEIGA
jgi:hypothetical protein